MVLSKVKSHIVHVCLLQVSTPRRILFDSGSAISSEVQLVLRRGGPRWECSYSGKHWQWRKLCIQINKDTSIHNNFYFSNFVKSQVVLKTLIFIHNQLSHIIIHMYRTRYQYYPPPNIYQHPTFYSKVQRRKCL